MPKHLIWESFGPVVPRRGVEGLRRGVLDDFALVHEDHAVGHLAAKPTTTAIKVSMKVKTTWLIVAGKVSRKSCGKMIRPVRCQPGRAAIDFESVPTRRGATNQAAAVRDAFEPLPACPRTPAAPFPTWSDPQQGKAFS